MLGQAASEQTKNKALNEEAKSKIRAILAKSHLRGKGILISDCLEILIAAGLSFEQIRILSLVDFNDRFKSLTIK